MIVTVTLNPAVDQTAWVRSLAYGKVNRPIRSQLDPAGKGINVSRMAHRLGRPTIAFGFLAGDRARRAEALDQERVQNHFLRIPGQTRINVTINDEATGTATSFYEPGPSVDAQSLADIDEMVRCWLQTGGVLVLAGSLPPGVPTDIYGRWIAAAREHRVLTILDAEGEPLAAGLHERPTLIKPNRGEAEQLVGRPLPDLHAVADAARELAARGSISVISLAHEGAVCADRQRAFRVRPPRVERLSAVGSGDSLVAGLAVALARQDTLEAGMRLGTAAGAATAASPGTALGDYAAIARLLPEVVVDEL